jgi:hypothetical protein
MLRKILKTPLLILGSLLVAIQLVRPSRSNPPVDPAHEFNAIHATAPAVSSLLQRSCGDCHSNKTAWPWYSNVAPASWVIAHDVNDGRDALNLSEWGVYTLEKRQKLIGEMCKEVKNREMPLSQYTLVHSDARLTAPDVQTLCSWSQDVARTAGVEEGEHGED